MNSFSLTDRKCAYSSTQERGGITHWEFLDFFVNRMEKFRLWVYIFVGSRFTKYKTKEGPEKIGEWFPKGTIFKGPVAKEATERWPGIAKVASIIMWLKCFQLNGSQAKNQVNSVNIEHMLLYILKENLCEFT